MSSEGIFTGMDAAVMNGLNTVIQGQMSLYSTLMAGLVTGSATLYILWRGYQTLAGKLHTPVEDVAWDLARMGIILAFVTNADGYLDASVAAINGLKDGLSGSENVWVLLDTLWGKAQILGEKLFNLDDSTYVQLNGGIAELLVWGGTIVTLVIATIVNMGAEIMLLLMTTTAPIFIFCLIYGFLRPMFNNWLQVIFTAILTLMFSALSLRIAIQYLSSVLDKASSGADVNNIVTLAAQSCLAGIGAGFVVWLSAKIAGSLAGASVQGVVQGAAKMGLMAGGGAAKKAASTVGKPVGNALGSIGDKAANNLKGSSASNAKASAKAAVEKMKAQN
ncbi:MULTISPECIES: TrbL/VirB6 family protein [Enterobacteriaceae]|uniref:Conjugal transfer protein TrbL n=1 Tax=Citrobacter freundii TaxID=546 RepID=A0AA44SHY5_CITFR|nr:MULTISPECIES: type IV secretion system protein [Citrobacter freundii complex]ELW8194796.1 type IV secretion system protein [Yersinia enterocolitica]HDT2136554.1 type IV secretion system protein [Enterobacter roggenkampii]MDW2761402.1 type IV secretion system protein [Citrobacter freundii]OYQ91598.1 conjugal transfer protein TrbL [Citrobacter freundii]OYQ93964.1 conjugal transfer protein TrbL [Citrobacter freundii]